MKLIKYWTTHPDTSSRTWHHKLGLPSQSFTLNYDPISPDYIIATEHIYFDRLVRIRFRTMFHPERVTIFWAGECIFPDMNIFDYAMCYDKNLVMQNRIVRRPVLSLFGNFKHDPINIAPNDPASELSAKSAFCNFIYSNPAAHPRRDWLFHTLTKYKRVDSLGPHLHNCDVPTSRDASNFDEISVEMKRPYKFSISAENASYLGYTSEKIITSFLARTIPIYWGNPDIASEFNPKAFINANGLSSTELINTVSRIDNNRSAWENMISEPPMTEDQYKRAIADEQHYTQFMANLFSMPVRDAICRPVGFWPENYTRSFLACHTCQISPVNRLLKAFGRETRPIDWLIRKIRHSDLKLL